VAKTINPNPSALRVLVPVGIGTALSLLGDSTLYAVLPTHTSDAGVTIASVGILLSINRWIRVFLNGPAGIIFDRWKRRPLFVAALFIGALSTAIYGLTQGFWPLLIGRLLWGLSWSAIWVGGTTIIFDISQDKNRGRRVGYYQLAFYLGAASGAILGGILTDKLGYGTAMRVHASLTLLGAFIALLFLPETAGGQNTPAATREEALDDPALSRSKRSREFAPAAALYGINRFVIPGILISTFGLFLSERLGESVEIAGTTLGVTTLTGVGLGVSTLISMVSAPVSGALSDRVSNRWKTVSAGLLPGIAGFVTLALGSPLMISLGLPLISLTSGSNQGLATTIVGDTSIDRRQSRELGLLFTIGDLMSAAGPMIAYALIPVLQISGLYVMAALLFAGMFFVTLRQSFSIKIPSN
jgi:MFS family permease